MRGNRESIARLLIAFIPVENDRVVLPVPLSDMKEFIIKRTSFLHEALKAGVALPKETECDCYYCKRRGAVVQGVRVEI